jgi:hypothetical protein
MNVGRMSQKPSIEAMWEDWNKIASSVIPIDFDMRDAIEGANCPDGCITEDSIRERMEYLSDRLDPARCYWLDYKIRLFLGKEMRDNLGDCG